MKIWAIHYHNRMSLTSEFIGVACHRGSAHQLIESDAYSTGRSPNDYDIEQLPIHGAPQWTADRPTESGLYWLRTRSYGRTIAFFDVVSDTAWVGDEECRVSMDYIYGEAHEPVLWCGPLPEPED